jgi:type I restriction enzyme, S subunit
MVIPEGWSLGQLADGIELISGQHIEANLCSNDPNGMPYLTGPSDFPDGKIIVTKYTSSPKVCCKAGDILITVKGSGTGKIVVSDADYCISRQLMAVRAERFDSGFVFQFLSTKLEEFSEASTGLIPGISRSDVTEKPLNIPPLEEQVKIAEVLTAWDDALETLGKLIAAKLELKRGLMQALLTGKKRFQEFETREWAKRRIETIIKESRIQGLTGVDAQKITVKLYGRGVFPKNEKRLGSENTKYFSRKSGQFIYSKLDFLNGAFGIIPNHLDGFETTLDLPCFDFLNEVNPEYFLQFVSRVAFYDTFQAGAMGGRIARRVNPDELLAIDVSFPPLEEQTRIAEVLTTLDTELEGLRGQLQRVKTQKKGLMQQLLTGKIRVKV